MKGPGIKIAFLDGIRLHNAITAGTRELERRKEELNQINVFPVPDGDTGDNMASTLGYIAAKTKVSKSLSITCESMAEAALMGSRGNSGLIMAQYLYGFSFAIRGKKTINTVDFSESLVKAIPFAEETLITPVEGTIITVLREWAEKMFLLSVKIKDFGILLPESLVTAKDSLLRTQFQLDILSQQGVVDAGAQGLVDFLQGIADFIDSGDLRDLGTIKPVTAIQHPDHGPVEEIPEFRYCSEAIVEGPDLSRNELKNELSSWGDSVIIGGHDKKFRIHIHTNTPEKVFERISQKATLNEQKADDMLRQVQVKNKRASSIALVTDSACDIPEHIMDKYQIHMIPLKITLDKSTYLDKITIKPDRIYRLIGENKISVITSQPGPVEFTELYRFLLNHYDSVISLHLSSQLSGTWNSAFKAASSFNDRTIHVIDSKNLCSGLGLLVLKAAEAIASGKNCEETLKIIEESTSRTKIFVSLETLEYMIRGGRISPLKGKMAKLLNLKPLISLDPEGKGIHYGNACGKRGNLKKILNTSRSLLSEKGIEKYAVVHAHAREGAEDLAERLKEIIKQDPEYIMDISTVIGINSGPGSIAVSMILQE